MTKYSAYVTSLVFRQPTVSEFNNKVRIFGPISKKGICVSLLWYVTFPQQFHPQALCVESAIIIHQPLLLDPKLPLIIFI